VLGRENNLHLHMRFRAEETLPDLRFRLVLFSGGSPVGLVTGKHGFSADAGENQVEMELDLGLLAPGSYTGRAVLYESNPYGGEKILDVADPAVIFRKEENDTGDGTQVWKPSVWGHIRFPAAEVKLCD
jgi:hypothetical protein